MCIRDRDSAASAVKSSINKQFIKVLAEQVFKETNVISDDMKDVYKRQ